jgi:hypothetical protein
MSALASRQLNINLPENVAEELEHMAQHSTLGMVGVMRTALALAKIASEVQKNKQKLVVADQTGKPIEEIVLPK